MKKYKEFLTTAFDPVGRGLAHRQDWMVMDVIRTRDSDALTESNFAAALREVGGESVDVEVHRFGHWGPGWFEIIIVRPGSAAERAAEEVERSLENYPVLDEEDMSEREHEAYLSEWRCMGHSNLIATMAERIALLGLDEHGNPIEDPHESEGFSEYLDNIDSEESFAIYEKYADGCWEYDHEGVRYFASDVAAKIPLKDLRAIAFKAAGIDDPALPKVDPNQLELAV